jgi:hypothetical protein
MWPFHRNWRDRSQHRRLFRPEIQATRKDRKNVAHGKQSCIRDFNDSSQSTTRDSDLAGGSFCPCCLAGKAAAWVDGTYNPMRGFPAMVVNGEVDGRVHFVS